jgi:TolA-binding protein
MSTMPVFGTIEFDIDPTQARWLDAWIESGGPSRRLGPGAEIAAMRELTLVERLKDPRPKFLRQMEEERERAERLAAERASTEALEVARLAAEREEAEREAEQLRREVEEAERQAAQVRLEREDAEREAQRLEGERKREEREAEERRKEAERQLGDGKLNGSLNGSPWNQSTNVPGSPMNAGSTNAPSPTTRTLNVEDTDRELASRTSPATSVANVVIPTAPGMLSPTSPASSNEYRASGMIMADQLNTLEKSESKFDNLRLTAVVRDLSPRDIRFAQPRPRMGLAASPPVRMADLPARGSSMADLPSRGSSRLPYLRHSEVSAESSHSSPSPTNAPLPPAQWPAVPFKAGESPQSPGLHDYFQRANSSPLGPPVSHEYAARVKSAESAHRATHHGSMPVPINAMTERPRSGPPPKRPARPPTPDLTMPETVPHVLPLELLKHNSPTPPSVPVFANRPNSISLKSLARRASSKNLRPKERAHAYAIANSRGDYVPPQPHHPRQESNTSYTSYSSSKSRGDSIGSADDAQNVYQPFRSDEFGQLDQDAQSPHSAGHPHRKDGSFTSRFFSFGGRRARESEDRPMTIVHISNPISVTHNPVTAAELVSAAGGMSPGPLSSIAASPMSVSGPSMSGPWPISPQSLVSPNSLSANSHASTANLSPAAATPGSVVGFSTPNPSTSTLGPNDARMSGDEHRGSMPNSPTSPRHVRRKPVPGIEGERDSVYEE